MHDGLSPRELDGQVCGLFAVDIAEFSQPRRQLKQGLAEANTEIAVIASDYFYATVIRRQPSLTSPAQYRRLNVRVKETRARAWTHLPGR